MFDYSSADAVLVHEILGLETWASNTVCLFLITTFTHLLLYRTYI